MAMTYTGDVKPGGSPDTRELTHLTITKLAVDEKMSNNCYLLTCRSTGESVLSTRPMTPPPCSGCATPPSRA